MLLPQRMLGLLLIMLFNNAVDGVCSPEVNPLRLHPPAVVAEHGTSISVNCSSATNHSEIGWVVSGGGPKVGPKDPFVTWSVENVSDWDVQPQCYMNMSGFQCHKQLFVTVYKRPDSVSISSVDHTDPMVEGSHYQLQCDIKNIAPVQYLTVKWYKGQTLVNQTSFDDLSKTPVNESSTLLITPRRADDGAQYRCVAELHLGPEGPQPPPTVTSEPLSITVHVACPVELNPPKVVVKYGDSVSVNCTASISNANGMSWESTVGGTDLKEVVQLVTWRVEELTEWTVKPQCLINTDNTGKQCEKVLPVILYKTPDSVSISSVNHTGPMVEGSHYQLQCDIENIAPVQYLTVKWYKGQTLVNQTSFGDLSKTPVNESSTLLITPRRADDGAQYRCVAELHLGPEGPQPPPTVTSEPLSITVHVACPVELNPPKVVVKYGDSVSVNCTASISNANGMSWESTVGGTDLKEVVQLVTWRVEELTEWTVKPQCLINTDNTGKQCEKVLPVILYKTPDSVSISSVNHTGPMVEGSHYQLQCDIENIAPVQYLTVKWYKGQTLVNQTSFGDLSKTPVNEFSTLLITPSRADDGAQYRCVAELHLGPEGPQPPPTATSEPFNITVHYKPVIQSCSNWFPVKNTILDSFRHTVIGNPVPQITWYRGRREFNISVLLSKEDTGQYVYNATNYLGHTSCTINITVEYAPEFTCPQSYEGTEGKIHNLTCTAEGYPEPKISCFKRGAEVHLPFPILLTRQNNGLYQLTAINRHGSVNHTLSINIVYAPELLSENNTVVTLTRGSDVSLNCRADGAPTPGFGWSNDTKGGNLNVTTKWRQSTLTITGATSANAGVYTCTATNKVGRATMTFTLVITEKPDYSIAIYCIIGIIAFIVLVAVHFYWKYKRTRLGQYDVTRSDVDLNLLGNGTAP